MGFFNSLNNSDNVGVWDFSYNGDSGSTFSSAVYYSGSKSLRFLLNDGTLPFSTNVDNPNFSRTIELDGIKQGKMWMHPQNITDFRNGNYYFRGDYDLSKFNKLTSIINNGSTNFKITGLTLPVASTSWVGPLSFQYTDLNNVDVDASIMGSEFKGNINFQSCSANSITFPTTSYSTSVNVSNNSINGPLNLTGLTNLNGVVRGDGCGLTDLFLPLTSGTITQFWFFDNSLSGNLDTTNLTISSSLHCDNNNLTGITLQPTSLPFTLFRVADNNLTGTVNLTGLTGIGGTVTLYNNPNLNSILFSNTNTIDYFYSYNCDLTGTLNLTGTTILKTIILYNNPNLNKVVFSPSATGMYLIQIYSCDLDDLDLSNVVWSAESTTSLIDFKDNYSLTGITFPSNVNGYITQIRGSNTNISGNMDLTILGNNHIGYVGYGGNIGMIDFVGCSGLTGITIPNTDGEVNYIGLSDCDLQGTLNLSGITNFGYLTSPAPQIGGLIGFNNTGLTEVILPITTNKITSLQLFNCNLSDFDLLPISGTSSHDILIELQVNNISTPNVDNILINLDTFGWTGGTLNISGSNGAPDSPGITAKNNLISKGWTVTTN